MAIYVTSDLHGLELYRLKQLLKRNGFCKEDTLYILGDIIDRQNKGGVDILCWMLEQSNVKLILGNHEEMLLGCEYLFSKETEPPADSEKRLSFYRDNGGDYTLDALRELEKSRPWQVKEIFDYLRKAPLYVKLTLGQRKYLLLHGGLGGFSPERAIEDYSPQELLWSRPEYDESYYEDTMTVLGHTPTVYYGREHKGKILFRPTWTDIDVGVAYGNSPIIIDLREL